MTPYSFDLSTARELLGDEVARRIEEKARKDADAGLAQPPEVRSEHYWGELRSTMARAVYQAQYDKRRARNDRKALKETFPPDQSWREGLDVYVKETGDTEMNHIPSPLPKTSDEWLEHDIKAAGADKGPRITPADIEANIASEHYFTAQDGVRGSSGQKDRVHKLLSPAGQALSLLTFCVLVLRNGFTVTGESACASPENFNAEIGRKIARENAVAKVWPLMGYALRQHLHNMELVDRQLDGEVIE